MEYMGTHGFEAFRRRHNLSLRDWADGAGIPLTTLSCVIRTGNATRRTIDRLLRHARQIEPGITYEALVGSELEG